MTVHVLAVAPPHPGLALPELRGVEGLDGEGRATLAGAMIGDTAVAVARSGGELVVAHPTAEGLPDDVAAGEPSEETLRALVGEAIGDLDSVRFEPLVGETSGDRVGRTVTGLFEEDGVDSVAVLDGRSPLIDRSALDGAAMKLRRSDVVLAPGSDGRVAYLGTTEAIDLGDAWPAPVAGLVEQVVAAGHDVDFAPMQPRVATAADLATLVSVLEARRRAGRRVPERTVAAIETLGLTARVTDAAGQRGVGTTDRA